MLLYKYQAINAYSLSNLAAKKHWASKPAAFNDPFEFRVNRVYSREVIDDVCKHVRTVMKKSHEGLIDTIGHEALGTYFAERVEKNLHNWGVVCFSKIPDDILLWGHYTECHHGFCAGFEVPDLVSKGIRPVTYSTEYHNLNLKNMQSEEEGTIGTLTTKSIDWKYEKEFRQIVTEGDSPVAWPGKLATVIFGLRASKDHRNLIRSIINDASVHYQSVSLHPSKYQLVLQAEPSVV